MRLGEFILANIDEILAAWEQYARKFWQGPLPSAKRLRNDAEAMIRAVVEDMTRMQTQAEKKAKSEGTTDDEESDMGLAAGGHALARVEDGFDIVRMVAEFRALRATVSRIWWASVPVPHREQIADMERFNEAMDHLVAASVKAFMEHVDRNRQIFLGILGHDMRQPLQTIRMLTAVLHQSGMSAETAAPVLPRLDGCCESMGKMLADLLDYTSTQLGTAMPVKPAKEDLGALCREVLARVRATAPHTVFHLEASGDLAGEWDGGRLGQLVTNLLTNALQHGRRDRPITLRLAGSVDEVRLEVHNQGAPIPEELIGTIFDPMMRLGPENGHRPHGSMGLGLYICRQIALAHGGEIEAESSAEKGTTLTLRLPKREGSRVPGDP